MKQTKYLKCACQHCGGHIEFPAEIIGQSFDCPHCLQRTELTLPPPPSFETSEISRKSRIWVVAGVVILVIAVVGTAVGMVWLKRIAARSKRQNSVASSGTLKNPSARPAVPSTTNDEVITNSLIASRVILDKPKGSRLVYAMGVVKNASDHQRFGVKVELDLFDKSGAKIGTASDYCQVLEPKAEWHFKALVIDPKAASAKLAEIKEDQ
jgi:hypothetical protein